jgi:hypothetical protein
MSHDDQSILGKLTVVWVATITGMTVTDWAALFAIVYTFLQIVVLVRDKFFRRSKA